MKNFVLFKRINSLNSLTSLSLVKNFTLSSACRTTKLTSTYSQEYKRSLSNPEEYWNEKKNLIEWFTEPTQIVDRSNSPFEKWYANGSLNATYNCLDYHVKNGFGDQVALIHDSPLTNTIKKITYKELLNEVSLFAGVLSNYGVKKGDRVLIYMPMIPQAVTVMLASARIGAIHSLVFGGFASKELSVRINHAKPKIIVSANTGVEPGRLINYKELLDAAVEMSEHKPKKCIFYNREMFPEVDFKNNRDLYLNYEKEISKAKPHDCIPVDSNFPLYLLYTSGTTGLPKGVVRMTAGYLIALKNSMSKIYGANPGETFCAFSDLGWTVGHSYICYGPLAARNTAILYEGKPVGTPDSSSWFRVLSEHKVVSAFGAPTAIRAIKQQDPEAKLAKKYNLDWGYGKNGIEVWQPGLAFNAAGEHCDHETMDWIRDVVKKPVFDHWWQTETGHPITSICAGYMSEEEMKSVPNGVSGKAVPGYDIRILRDDGTEASTREMGRIVIKLPLPPGTMSTLWENDELFKNLYFKKYPGFYDTADVGFKCENGYLSIMSRADDVINVSGHRLSSSAIEEAILEHHELSECAVVELSDKLKGSVPFGFLVRNKDSKSSEKELIEKIVNNVRDLIGPIACFKQAVVVDKLPKTRSGKIARNTLKAMINNKNFQIPVTIEDAEVYGKIKKSLISHGYTNIRDPTL